ncbi:MAG: TIGR00269 family protein [Candidatus Thermoplasmatota archaeon]|nr:TIGR00269 family protein [Candidatus Thermoplasmatota archaeon]
MEGRVRKEIRRQGILAHNSTVCVAVSGGKDSMTALTLMKEFSRERRDIRLIAITVDEGITGYRSEALRLVEEYTDRIGVEWHCRSFNDEAGFTMDRLAPRERERTTCAYCGVFRRSIMNSMARDLGATRLVTGLNLDDTAQSVMMNIARGDMTRMSMMGPHERTVDGLVPRAQPLLGIPENEVLLYAIQRGIPFIRSSCPYSEEASRNLFRDIVLRLEAEMPGSRYAVIKSGMAMSEAPPSGRISRCAECGDVTSGSECRACALRTELAKVL